LRGKSQHVQEKLAAAMQAASDRQDYERAAVLRDRIRVLTAMQARQAIHRKGLGDADVIAAFQQAGRTAIQVFFFRDDRNYGTRTFFVEHDKLDVITDIMGSFVGQFYADKQVPPLLLLSHTPRDARPLADALTVRAGRKVALAVPRSGERKRLVDHARQNAKTALGRKMAESAEQERLLKGVAATFGLPEPPRRIEVYDNAHIAGGFPVGAMIAAGPEGFLKKTYRKFTIREAAKGDDYAMMNEVLNRRFRRLVDEDPERRSGLWPDLLLIDGGRGQLNEAVAVLQELGVTDVPVIAIAKGPDRNAGRERFFRNGHEPMSLPPEDPVLYYLQRLRDEAHRFAVGAHRAQRSKSLGRSGLDEIPGIGVARKRALLHYFGSFKAVAAAGADELRRVDGISASTAKKIYDYFHVVE
jgi:excinuclease ABC subunit C